METANLHLAEFPAEMRAGTRVSHWSSEQTLGDGVYKKTWQSKV